MDDGITEEKYDVFFDLVYGKANPNGCPVLGTFFVSADYTFHSIAKRLYDQGLSQFVKILKPFINLLLFNFGCLRSFDVVTQ